MSRCMSNPVKTVKKPIICFLPGNITNPVFCQRQRYFSMIDIVHDTNLSLKAFAPPHQYIEKPRMLYVNFLFTGFRNGRNICLHSLHHRRGKFRRFRIKYYFPFQVEYHHRPGMILQNQSGKRQLRSHMGAGLSNLNRGIQSSLHTLRSGSDQD